MLVTTIHQNGLPLCNGNKDSRWDAEQKRQSYDLFTPITIFQNFILPNAKIKLILEKESKEAGFGDRFNFWLYTIN